MALLLPFALVGILTHWPAYRLIGLLSKRLSKGEIDVVSTVKVAGAIVLFPMTWALLAGAGALSWGAPGAALALVLPACGWAALIFSERIDGFLSAAHALGLSLFRRPAVARLRAEQQAIRSEMLRLGETPLEIS